MSVQTFYNEIDKGAAEWMRQLIAAGEINKGQVNETSISAINPNELIGFGRAHFFAGIGGWDYALQLAGWPDEIPVWTGSCPCQPFSAAGKRKGAEDERHLWPEFRRLIAECRPPIVFGEQVASADGRLWLAGVRSDLEALGYAVGAADLCSAGVGAPNIRQRLYLVAYAHGQQDDTTNKIRLYAESGGGSATCRLGDSCRARTRGNPGAAFGAQATGSRERHSNGLHGGYQPFAPGPISRLEHPTRDGREQRWSESSGRGTSSRCGLGYWDAFDILPCLDGKARRVEPGSFPLVAGISRGMGQVGYPGPPFDPQVCAEGRVMRLRGYGNAINVQVAAEFISATMEAIGAV